MISQYALQVAAFGVFAGFVALPTGPRYGTAPAVNPAISEEAAAAVSQMGKTLLTTMPSLQQEAIDRLDAALRPHLQG